MIFARSGGGRQVGSSRCLDMSIARSAERELGPRLVCGHSSWRYGKTWATTCRPSLGFKRDTASGIMRVKSVEPAQC